ncbi:MAG: PKD domain-containing protein [Bacteroidota bacterium]
MPLLQRVYLTTVCICSCLVLNAQVNADFTFDVSTGCGSLAVSFCDNSTSSAGTITNWSWDLGGVTSNRQCPSRIFALPGRYTICLTATDNLGNSDQECKTELITVYNLPQPDFDATPRQGCVPLDVTFTDLSTSVDGTINEWLWGLGGSCGTVIGNGSVPAAQCTYTIPDTYNISLTVRDDNGCSNTVTKTNYVEVSALPDFSVAATDTFDCEPPFTVTFTNGGSAANIRYTWDFGNGQTFTGATPPPITYGSRGSYDVLVVAENTVTGCQEIITLPNYINVGQEASFTSSVTEGCEDLRVTFTDLSPEPADSVVWDFGDGNTSRLPQPTHTYLDGGCYFVTLTRYIDGCETVVTATDCIRVFDEPEATYSNNNSVGCELPHVVNFVGLPISADIVSWEWDFGDGGTSNQQNPIYSYTAFGDFAPELTVTNSDGCTFSVSVVPISIVELETDLVTTSVEGCSPLSFTLQESSNSIRPVVDWEWTINTGSNVYISNDQNGTFTIPDTGIFDVVLTVTNTLGCTDTETFEDVVSIGMLPVIDFQATPVEECIELPISFLDLSSSYVEEWLWQFGDGDESSAQLPTHEYQDTGFYDITLTGTHNGCSNTLTIPDYIHILEPLAKFDFDTDCENFTTVQFIDRSVGAERVTWDFGVPGVNTDTSSEFSPSFVFPGTGMYNVTQTAYNSSTQCQHSVTQVVHITDPRANFMLSSTQGCRPMTVNITDQSEFAIRWEWSAPGGTISNFLAPEPSIVYSTAGKYTNIQLIITDINECRDTLIFTDTVYVNQIDVDFVADPLTGCIPLDVNFTDQSTNLFANNIIWDWDISQAPNRLSEQNPTYTFTDTGYYDVRLTVRDEWGCLASMTVDSMIEITRPEALFRTADTLSCTQHCVSFEDLSFGKGLTYSWDFGDGNTSTDQNPVHCYAANGVYTVCLTVTDIYSCDSTLCLTDYVTIADPVAGFLSDSTFASCPPLPVNFTNTSINATEFLWDFGDGSGLSNQENPTHVYTIPGTYEVTLIARSTPFCADTVRFDDLIVLDGPEGDFSFEIDSSCAPLKVTFIANTIDNYLYIWDFGDGIIDSSATTLLTDTIVHFYEDAGEYTPAISIIDGNSCRRTLISGQSIFVSEIGLDFVASDTLFCDNSGQPVTFTNLSGSSHPILGFEWNFGGATPATSTDIQPTADFTQPGAYDITLIARNAYCSDTLTRPGYIGVGPAPQAAFSMDLTEGCEPLEVQFTDMSSVSQGSVNAWSWELGDGTTATATNPNHTYTQAGDLTVTLVAFSDVGCSDTTSQSLSVFALTPVDAGEDKTICIGEVTQLDGTITGLATNINWSPATGLSCTDCLTPLANPVDTTAYTLTITNAEGCVSTSQVVVNVRPFQAPVIELSNDTTICANDPVQIFVDGGDDVYSYLWDTSDPGLSCYENCRNPIVQTDTSTTYNITVSNIYGCQSRDSIAITVIDLNQPFAGDDRTICRGNTTALSTNGFGADPVWLVNTGLSCTYCPDPLASPDTTTIYVVETTTPEGCQVQDSVTVFVVQPDDVDAGDNEVVCVNSSIVLNGVGAGIVSWSPAATLSDPNSLTPEARPTTTTTYYLTVSIGECVRTDSVTIEVADKVEISVDDVTICEGDTVELFVNGQADNYTWLPSNDLSNLSVGDPLAWPRDTTEFTVIGNFSSCEPDTATVIVSVIPEPENRLIPVRRFFAGQTIELNIDGRGLQGYEYEWSPRQGLSCGGCIGPDVTPDSNVTYTLTVIDPTTGCTNTKSTRLEELLSCPDDLINVPNIFTPNGDGNNDELQMFLSPTLNGIYTFQIFNRWGELVFQTSDPSETWDGTHRGQVAPQGVYLYLIEAPCEEFGQRIMKKGDITLLR